MKTPRKFWTIAACTAGIIAFLLLHAKEIKERVCQIVRADLLVENLDLKAENDRLASEIKRLQAQNLRLETYLDVYENKTSKLLLGRADGNQTGFLSSISVPEGLRTEAVGIRKLYRKYQKEKKRWDRYHQQQYENILETTVEPDVIDSHSLVLENIDNLKYFQELERALRLHKRLIRDVRMFHDEVQYQKAQSYAKNEYQFYDLKFALSPFARESAIVDALHQAMSTLSAGMYQQEALEVLDRLGEEFTKPILKLSDQFENTPGTSIPIDYNYNFYIVFGKKLMEYADTLAQQNLITLAPSTLGELDFFNRRLAESLYDLYLLGHYEALDSRHLDLNELERVIYSGH
jgi:hypothetical protein